MYYVIKILGFLKHYGLRYCLQTKTCLCTFFYSLSRSMAAINDKAVRTVGPTKIMSLTSFSYLSRDLEPWSLLCFSSCGIE